jgi:hypothetical protein
MSLMADVEALKLSPLPAVRERIAEKVAKYYNKELFDENECKIACDIIRMLSRDLELKVRKTIADNIKDNKDIPHDIAMTLASDVLEVSLPILEFSSVLSDEDLVDIIKSTKQVARLIAISKRQNASEILSEELIKKSNEDVVVSLFLNGTAKISQSSLEYAFSQFKNSTNVVDALINRSNLSISVVEKILNTVSDNVRKELVEKHGMKKEQAESIINESREKEIVNLINGIKDSPFTEQKNISQLNNESVKARIEELVIKLTREGRLTESLIIRSICEGNLLFFEISMSIRAGIPHANASIILHDSNPAALRSLWKKAKMPESTLDAMAIIIHFATKNLKKFKTNSDYGQHLLEYLQQNSYDKTIPLMPYMMSLISSGVKMRNVL